MRRRFALGVLAVASLAAVPNPVPARPGFNLLPAVDAMRRFLPTQAAAQIRFGALPRSKTQDAFRVTGTDGRILISATTPATLLAGLNWYLKDFCHVSITWSGDSLARLPRTLPAPKAAYERRAIVPHRYAGNDTWADYTGPYWGFERWRREIDVLAANGINELLVYPGQVSVYYETFRRMGLSDRELRRWIPLPAHDTWFLTHNVHGATPPVPLGLMRRQAALGRRIADYLRSLGMIPVLSGYYGMVPPGFARRFPAAHVIDQGTYTAPFTPFTQSPQLDPTDPMFHQVAESFYSNSRRVFGKSSMYTGWPYHEGGDSGTTPMPLQYQAIQEAMRDAHPDSTWVLLAWTQTTTLPAGLPGADPPHTLLLDGMTDIHRVDPNVELQRFPWAFGSIWEYGGRTSMGARMAAWVTQFRAYLSEPGSTLAGIAVIPEAMNDNPAAFELLTELAWRPDVAELSRWMHDYAAYRYGAADRHADAAWQILAQTVYGAENVPSYVIVEQSDPFTVAPNVNAPQFPGPAMRYDTRFDSALAELLAVAPRLRRTSAYRYDLMDVARQALANHAHVLHDQLVLAARSRNASSFEALGGKWLRWIKLADRLTATNPQTLTGRYIAEAQKWGATPLERALTIRDALTLITTWGNVSSTLNDYANRGWQGMYGDFYYGRWKTYLTKALAALRAGADPPGLDPFAHATGWLKQEHNFPTQPRGHVHAVAREVLKVLATS